MTIEQRLKLIREVAEEIITEEELIKLLEEKDTFLAYDGFEPSGQVHIAQGILRAININKMIQAGAKFNMLVADWHAWANNKLGGDLDKIKIVGEYLIEIWRLTGMNLSKVNFIWASDFVKDDTYWMKVMQVARNSTLKRIIRTSQIMGRSQKEKLQASQILYPCMQVADIFQMDIDVCQLGMDQRKVNVLARELGPKLFNKKPLAVHHHMIMGLKKPKDSYDSIEDRMLDLKMSKSNPDSAIFMTDDENQIKKKIRKAYCPEGVIDENPILEYCRYFIFEKESVFKIERPAKFGGDIEFKSFDELTKAFLNKEVHPADIKNSVAIYLNKLIDPVRKAFETNNRLHDLQQQVLSFRITR